MFGIKTRIMKKNYRKENKDNYTELKNACDYSKIKVGKETYGLIDIKTYGGENCLLKIGNYCSIANDTVFILGGEHEYNHISTYPFKAKLMGISESKNKGDIEIADDVWIGYGATILSGVKIGQGAIIGAKSVVAKDIPPYAIYCGNKIIKYRFSEEIIKELLKIDYSILDKNFIKENMDVFYKEVTTENIKDIVKRINNRKDD